MLNHIVLMGRLTRDPELRRTGTGIPVASFSLAVDRDFGKTENGDRETDFIDIVAWRGTAEFVSKYFSKGRMAVVSGRLQIRNWTDKEGNRRRNAEVVADNIYFGESKRDNPDGGYGAQTYGGTQSYGGSQTYGGAQSYGGGQNYGASQNYGAQSYGAPQGQSYSYGAPPAQQPGGAPASDFALIEDEDEKNMPF